MLDNLLKDALKNMPKEEKEKMIEVLKRSIDELTNVISDYINVESKVYRAEEKAGYSVSDTPFYSSTYHLVNHQLLKRITNALNNIDELEKFKELEEIKKELLAVKTQIELPNSRWNNANRYQEPNNRELQTMVAEIISNGPVTKKASINKISTIIANYLNVELKIYNAQKDIDGNVAYSPSYISIYNHFNALMEKTKHAMNDYNEGRKIEKLRSIEKELLAVKTQIESNQQEQWNNANRYQEPNNPELQTRVAEILANNRFLLKQDFISEANQEQLPDNNSKNWNKVHCSIS